MKLKLLISFGCCLFFIHSISAQVGRLGFSNDLNGSFAPINYKYKAETVNTDGTRTTSPDIKINFYNVNFRGGGTLIAKGFAEGDTKFWIGDYWSLGFGVGMGTGSGNKYPGTTFNAMLGAQFGLASTYAIKDDFIIGAKVIVWGGEIFYDIDQVPVYQTSKMIYPTIQYKRLWASVGVGPKATYNREDYSRFDAEVKYTFKTDMVEAVYIGARFQGTWMKRAEMQSDYNRSLSIMSLTFGKYF